MISDRPCQRCGVIVKDAYHHQKYCPECARIVSLENMRKWSHNKRTTTDTFKCSVCGIDVKRTGKRQKYCKACALEAHDEYNRQYMTEQTKQLKSDAVSDKPKRKAKPKPLKGKFIGDAFYPTVTVKQPKISYTYNDIRCMATAQHISYKECAERLGV